VLREAARRVVEAADAGDVVAHVGADRAFHAGLLELAGNPVLTETVLRLRDRSRIYGRGGEVPRPILEHAATEHDVLLDLIEAGDAVRAHAVMTDHIRHVRREWSPITDLDPS
jgi:DNA-binding GntR family transcriptional regulator